MKIKLARITDLNDLCELDFKVTGNGTRRLMIKNSIKEMECYLMKDKTKIFSYAILKNDFFGNPFIHMLIVHPDFRRKGIGTQYIRFFTEKCGGKKLFTSTNISNKPMIKLLGHNGFVRSGIIYNLDYNDPELVFYKNLE